MKNDLKTTTGKGPERSLGVRSLLYIAILLSLLYVFALGLFFFLRHSVREEFGREQRELLNVITGEIEDSLKEIHDDLFYLTDSPYSPTALEDPLGLSGQIITELICSMLDYQNCYDHIRLLDREGQEIIRVNYDDAQEHLIVGADGLQNKSGRNYFTEALALSPYDIYVSPFDLNIENGQIEEPHKPMIRFARQIVNGEGQTAGMAIFNYRGDYLIEHLAKYMQGDSVNFYLLNEEGYYLHHEDKGKTFAFMFGRDDSFVRDYPDDWDKFTCGEDHVTRKNHFYVKCISPSPDNSRLWYAVLHADQEQITRRERISRQGIAIGIIILTPLFIFFGFLLGHSHEKNRWYMDELEQMARIDGLTGLYNLREIMNRLEYTVSLINRNYQDLTIAFIDVDNLKFFNDTYGHEYGDQLIMAAASSIKGNIRASDSAARIGGDEFIVIFPDCPLDKAEGIMEKTYRSYYTLGKESRVKGLDWTFSWGCAQYLEGESVKELIARADKIMYGKKHNRSSGGEKG